MPYSPQSLFLLRHILGVLIGVGIMIISSHLSIDIGPVPFTFQNAGVHLVAMMLPPGRAFLSLLVWLALGAIGFPLFALFSSGAERISGPTGGYFLGMLIAAPVMSACQFYWSDVFNKQGFLCRYFSRQCAPNGGLNAMSMGIVGILGSAIILFFGWLYLGSFYPGSLYSRYNCAFKEGVYLFLLPSVIKISFSTLLIYYFKLSKIGK